MSFVVAQLGARMHYAIPRILHQAGMLTRLYTDICGTKGFPRILSLIPHRYRPAGVHRLLGRDPLGVPGNLIRPFTKFGLTYARMRRASAANPNEAVRVFLWAAKRFCQLILRDGLGEANGVFTYNGEGYDLLRHARQRGLATVMEQTIAPLEVGIRLLGEEQDRFPGWEAPMRVDEGVRECCSRERGEWDESEVILCGSEFVARGIAECGGPVRRCVVVPYGLNWRASSPAHRQRCEGPLRVLTVGAVGLRKGAPYILEVAKLMRGRAAFRLVGHVAVSEWAAQELRRHVELVGPVPRSEVFKHFAWADVFLLPSVCEGSATVTYEALASGLPVVCTPNTGSIVRNDVDGFVTAVRDVGAVVACLSRLSEDRALLQHMSANATGRIPDFTLEAYGCRFLKAVAAVPSVASAHA